jgi:hypothetical protein
MSPTETATRSFGRTRTLKSPDAAPAAAPAAKGWGAYQKAASTLGDANLYLKVDGEKKIIVILDDAPFDFYKSHWVEQIPEGSKSVTCWDSLLDENDEPLMSERCALCAAGDKPAKISAFFNVISLENPSLPALKVWEMGKQAADQLAEYSEQPKTSPINKAGLYFEVSKATAGKRIEYRVKDVKGRDLEEDYGIPPLPQEVIEEMAVGKKTERLKEPLNEKQMLEVADLLP